VDLRQLEFFVAVVEEGQFTRAARRCNIAQSALSASIRALEHELGAALFTRTTRRVALTEAGRAFLVEARRTLLAAEGARAAVQDVTELRRGSLALGGIPTPSLLDQAALLADFRSRHPMIEIRYVRGTSMALVEDLRVGTLDAALISMPRRTPPGLQLLALFTESLSLVCPPGHRLARRRTIKPEDLAGEQLVGAPAGSVAHRVIDDHLRTAAADAPTVPFDVNDTGTILDFVAHGLGIALLQTSLAGSRPDLCAIPLRDKTLTWTLALALPVDEHLSPAAAAFRDQLLELRIAPTRPPASG
jgi:DNA-binding transcriptional LysR family regulator